MSFTHPSFTNPSFTNQFIRELPGEADDSRQSRSVHDFWSPVTPTPVTNPQLLAFSSEVAALLGIDPQLLTQSTWLNALAGNQLLPGMVSYASNYGGHQFGHWAGQLGDGRAIFLGEITHHQGQSFQGQSFELQLKGAGPTPYSRRSDGRAVLRSSMREFLCSEAMHYLGIATTRALSLISTGEQVVRDMFYDGHPTLEPGAIVCRVAPTFLRFGHFELWASRQNVTKLQRLVDFTRAHYFPEQHTLADWFQAVCARTAILISHWMRVGFVHGVMNTDNMSITGLTLDYGPYGWLDNFDPNWTPNTTDAQGRRYCFARQPEIARWNLQQLANALSLLPEASGRVGGNIGVGESGGVGEIGRIGESGWANEGLAHYDRVYQQHSQQMLTDKFGLDHWQENDAPLINEAFALLQQADVDMTEFFKALEQLNVDHPHSRSVKTAFYQESLYQQFQPAVNDWLARYAARIRESNPQQRQARMRQANPRFILRNYLVQQAIESATEGDLTLLHQLHARLRDPYNDHPADATLFGKRPDWAKNKAGCSMLSCSS